MARRIAIETRDTNLVWTFLPMATAAGEAAPIMDHRMAYGCWTATVAMVRSVGSQWKGKQDDTYADAATAGQPSGRTWLRQGHNKVRLRTRVSRMIGINGNLGSYWSCDDHQSQRRHLSTSGRSFFQSGHMIWSLVSFFSWADPFSFPSPRASAPVVDQPPQGWDDVDVVCSPHWFRHSVATAEG